MTRQELEKCSEIITDHIGLALSEQRKLVDHALAQSKLIEELESKKRLLTATLGDFVGESTQSLAKLIVMSKELVEKL